MLLSLVHLLVAIVSGGYFAEATNCSHDIVYTGAS